MNEIATMARRMRTQVRQKIFMSFRGLSPNNKPATRAARKHPVPVAESQFRSKRAASGVGLATTGAAREMALCRKGTSHPGGPERTFPLGSITLNAGVVAWFMASLTDGMPHSRTKTERITKGIHAFAICCAV